MATGSPLPTVRPTPSCRPCKICWSDRRGGHPGRSRPRRCQSTEAPPNVPDLADSPASRRKLPYRVAASEERDPPPGTKPVPRRAPASAAGQHRLLPPPSSRISTQPSFSSASERLSGDHAGARPSATLGGRRQRIVWSPGGIRPQSAGQTGTVAIHDRVSRAPPPRRAPTRSTR